MTQSSEIKSTEEHSAPIVGIHFMNRSGVFIIFTSQEGILRAFSSDGNSITYFDQKPTPNCSVTKFLSLPNDQLFCGLSNGKFMIWDLSNNQAMEDNGHGQGRSITEVMKYEAGQQSFLITGDSLGKIQIRDSNTYQPVVPEASIQTYHQLPGLPPGSPGQCHMAIESIVVIPLGPNNEPFLFVSSGGGFVYIIQIGQSQIGLGIHNDGIQPNIGKTQQKYKPTNFDLEIGLIFKTTSDDKFCSLSKNGNLRQWCLNQVKPQPAQQPNQQQLQFQGQQMNPNQNFQGQQINPQNPQIQQMPGGQYPPSGTGGSISKGLGTQTNLRQFF